MEGLRCVATFQLGAVRVVLCAIIHMGLKVSRVTSPQPLALD